MWIEEHGKVLAEWEAALRRGGEGRRKDGTEEAPNSIHQRTPTGMDKFRIARLGVVTLGEWEEMTGASADPRRQRWCFDSMPASAKRGWFVDEFWLSCWHGPPAVTTHPMRETALFSSFLVSTSSCAFSGHLRECSHGSSTACLRRGGDGLRALSPLHTPQLEHNTSGVAYDCLVTYFGDQYILKAALNQFMGELLEVTRESEELKIQENARYAPHTGNELAREETGYNFAKAFPRPKSATFSKPKMTDLIIDRQSSHSGE
ncbi:hypothetical protein B0H13DRAFT_1879105 [Mycena leptocephala]|nr:hypothetical protein B0H13DRAFT_1879105 [Mycena leptocephala]